MTNNYFFPSCKITLAILSFPIFIFFFLVLFLRSTRRDYISLGAVIRRKYCVEYIYIWTNEKLVVVDLKVSYRDSSLEETRFYYIIQSENRRPRSYSVTLENLSKTHLAIDRTVQSFSFWVEANKWGERERVVSYRRNVFSVRPLKFLLGPLKKKKRKEKEIPFYPTPCKWNYSLANKINRAFFLDRLKS